MVFKARNIERKIKKQIPSGNFDNDYYQFGWDKFGPFLYGYTRWLYKRICDNVIDKVFFFSRDGFMMNLAFKLINTKHIYTEYVYFSRKSLRQALLWKCETFEESLKYLTWERFITLGKLLEYYGFNEKERTGIANKYELNLFQEYRYESLKYSNEIKKIYTELKSEINLTSKKQDALLLRYLYQINFSGKCAIVDIGWHGSMQYYLEEFLSANNIDVKIYGFYVGILPTFSLKGKTEGFLYNEENLKFRKSVLCFFGGYEKLFQSTEGTVYGYEYKNGQVVPVLNSYEYAGQMQVIFCIIQWQKGALDFMKKALSVNISLSDRDLAMPLIKAGRNPTMKDVQLFSFFYNTDGTKVYYVSQKPLSQYHLQELVYSFSNSVWKTGFMKSVFRLPLPYYYLYCLMKK